MLSEAIRQRILAEGQRYPEKRSALLPSLKLAQTEVGWLPRDVVAEVADLLGLSHQAAIEITTFYTMLRKEDPGGCAVEVCIQLPCAVRGSETLYRKLAEHLGADATIEHGHGHAVAKDGSATAIATVECFGSCHRAPMCRVNDEYWEHLDTNDLSKLLARIDELAAKYRAKTHNIGKKP
jgi:NADH-quinone oxidoreductase subunit E